MTTEIIQPTKLAMLIQRVDDSETLHQFVRELGPHVELEEVTSKAILADEVDWKKFDLFILDEEIRAFDSINFVRELKVFNSSMSIIMLTRKSDRNRAVDAMKAGATDYIFKRDLSREIFEKSLKFCQERTNHEREIKQRNLLIESLFEQSNDAVFLCDDDWNLMEYNQEFEQFFQLDKRKSKYNLSQLVDSFRYRGLYNLVATNEELVNKEFAVSDDEGKKHYSVSIKHIELPELGFRKLGTIYDITARKIAEKEQLRSEKLELTSRMARILAHEVRNPLTNIRLSIDYLNEFFEQDEEGKMYSEIIERNTERINKLIDDLLQSSKPFELKFRSVRLEEIVNNVLTQTNDRKELLGVEISTQLEADLPQWYCDPEKLELVLINLITNAFEAMQIQEKPLLSLKFSQDGNNLVILLEDNGKGMSEEVSERLFDAFFSNRKGGMGLGMTTVKNVVNGHKGKIKVRSEENVGTEFEIILPKMDV